MPDTNLLSKRFSELTEQLKAVAATKEYKNSHYTSGDYIDGAMFTNWKLKARHLIAMACGDTSEHYKEFVKRQDGSGYSTNYDTMVQLQAVFEAAQEDFRGGYLNSVRNMVQAEVFSTELDQASELLKGGYISAAAVIAGVVLETTLRKLCNDEGIEPASLNKMNAELTKAGAYNLLVQKRITALADIRNNAAHGRPEAFTRDDVEDMIAKVEAFVADHV
jgi:hypothetical protein